MDRTFIPVDNVGRRWHNNHVCSSSTTRLAGCDELRETVDTIKTGDQTILLVPLFNLDLVCVR